ncbi:MAG: tetratricopeptide repeat protein [Candidatus Gastranaerophilales bacterium]|nr:tetratricopeptide repeat protein [Candidatus Gastranaerophilales bacterium]
MTQGFFQFNNFIINEIKNFAISSYDLLFMSGSKGNAKSETIEKIKPELEENNLIFQHFCFENTVIDDFILNFYDALRNFSITQKFTFKKSASDNFKEKISHYFKTINTNSIIIVENFEKIDTNTEIIDFLSHLAGYANVKIIIITRNGEKNLFKYKNIKTKTLEIEGIEKEDFKSKLSILTEPMSLDVKEKFYEITSGLELYLKMSVKYCTTTNTTIADLINEFERKNLSTYIPFEEFLVTKFVSLVPSIYKNLLKILSAISHPVSLDFLNIYKLGNISYIEYLAKNFLVSKFKNEYYVKDYFRQYIIKSFSIQEKVSYYKNLIEIYENELTKSPKDRLVRLSRESIRKEIEDFKIKIPSINQNEKSNKIPYLGISTSPWKEEKTIQRKKLAEKLNKIKERRNFLASKQNVIEKFDKEKIKQNKEEKERNKRFIIDLINSSRDYANNYQFDDALIELKRAEEMDFENEFQIEILILTAKNNEALNRTALAFEYYQNALEIAKKLKDSRVCEIEFLIGLLEKSTFKIEDAKTRFNSIINNETNSKNFIAKASIELGEIEEANSNVKEAANCYKKALDISLGKDKALACKCYYKLGVLYDEHQDWENAIINYQKNYITSSESKDNKYYSVCLTNLALIFSEQGKYKDASEYLKLALIYDSEINDYENMYFSQKELAKLYIKLDEISAIGYYKQALNSAKKLNDTFKEALVHFEMGDFYYEKQEDEKALVNFLNAKTILKKVNDNENISRIESRIKDIKLRLDSMAYNLITQKYENQN